MKFTLPPELEELRDLSYWVGYKLVWNPERKKNGKIPYNPHTGDKAKANDRTTWGTFPEAAAAVDRYQLDGVGIEFGEQPGALIGIDLDGVVKDGVVSEFAAEIVRTLDSYTEYSPSGTGLHILAYCAPNVLGSGRRNDSIGLEMYNQGRFFTVTGNVYNHRPLDLRSEAVAEVIQKYLTKPERKPEPPKPSTPTVGTPSASNGELWQKMFSSSKGAEVRRLFEGDTSRHQNDHSRADQALMNHLAYWTNGNAGQMDDMFRESGLMRPKWDERRGSMTYGEKTIENALKDFKAYTPPRRSETAAAQPAADHEAVPGAVVHTVGNGKALELDEQRQQVEQAFAEDTQPDSVEKYIFGVMGAEMEHFKSFKDRKTGYSNLDSITSLYPGLYVIGAISSLGKTTFTHQLGDQLAAAGDHVLYFSLEQTRLEMVSKGISRVLARETAYANFAGAKSAIEIRRGDIDDRVRKAAKKYAQSAKTESVIECGFDTTIDTIVEYVNAYIDRNGVKPVVIVDYLQIIRPADTRQTTKDVVDGHVRALKKLQTDNDLVVMVISSLNRQNYLTPVDFESFKESGGIEYTADVIWGLQLAVMNTETFDKKDNLKAKREAVKAAKLETPRKIELVCLKNRYGRSSYTCNFNYYPQYDWFVPEEDYMPVDDDNENPFAYQTRM